MSNSVVSVPVPVPVPVAVVTSDVKVDVNPTELIVPPPLIRIETKKTQPKNLALVLSICGKALDTFGSDKHITSVTILILLQHIIMAINTLTKLNVEEKKDLALVCIQWLIDHQKDLTEDEKNILDLLALNAFPQVVDLLAEGGSSLKACFKSCFSCSN